MFLLDDYPLWTIVGVKSVISHTNNKAIQRQPTTDILIPFKIVIRFGYNSSSINTCDRIVRIRVSLNFIKITKRPVHSNSKPRFFYQTTSLYY